MDDVNFAGWTWEKSIQVIPGDPRTRVLVKGRPYMSWPSGDEESARMAIVQLSDCGLGTQEELAKVFDAHVNSVQRYLTDFEREGMRGLLSGRSGPKTRWKLTPELRGKILRIVLREGIWKLEAIQQRLAEAWREEVSVASIQQVLAENGLGEPPVRRIRVEAVTGELFGVQPERQLVNLAAVAQAGWEGTAESSEPQSAEGGGNDPGSGPQAGERDEGMDYRRNYSPAQRVYLDRLEQGDYNAYAGGLLFAPLLARHDSFPTLRRLIAIPTYAGYRLEELSPTLFYWMCLGFGRWKILSVLIATIRGCIRSAKDGMGRVKSR